MSAPGKAPPDSADHTAFLDPLAQVFDLAASIVAGVADDQLTDPTPCSAWDVETLLRHMTGVVINMGRGASGEGLLTVADYRLGVDRAGQFRSEVDRTLAAWSAPEVSDLVDVGGGPMPARTAITVNLIDTATHAWDLARATGQVEDLPDELAALILDVCHGFVSDELRAGVGFDPPVHLAAGASSTAQLVAFLGRRP